MKLSNSHTQRMLPSQSQTKQHRNFAKWSQKQLDRNVCNMRDASRFSYSDLSSCSLLAMLVIMSQGSAVWTCHYCVT